MFGKMSVGVRRIENTPSSVIRMASTKKVYGRRSASLTIHIWPTKVAQSREATITAAAPVGYR